ncbi:MAG: nicotinate (nicotinamide) nucleotide adenylyltransferase [Bdellovibrionales bacterium]
MKAKKTKTTKKVTAKKSVKKTSTKKTTKKAAAPKTTAKKMAVKQVESKKTLTPKATKKSLRLGMFGGSFNPFHMGHLNSLETIAETCKLKKIFVIPSYQTPGKSSISSPTPAERLEMTRLGLEDYSDKLVVDDREVQRKGVSYTVDTLESLIAEQPMAEWHVILGADLLPGFSQWKDYEKILELANLVVTTRPGSLLPFRAEDLPQDIQPWVKKMDRLKVTLKTGKTIQFVQLEDRDISGTEIRKCVRSGLKVDKYISIPVEKYITEKKLYVRSESEPFNFRELSKFCADVLFDKKGFNVKGYDLSQSSAPSEFAIIASGTSTRHVAGLASAVVEEVKKKFGINPLSSEGLHEGRWGLVDFGGLIVHVFYDFVRNEYRLEELWARKVEMELKDSAMSGGAYRSPSVTSQS